MATRRQKRLNELLREELSLLIPGRLDDPRVVLVSVTRVETTRDMTMAKVYITVSGSEEEAELAMQGLEHAKGFLRSQMSGLGLRRLPELVFARDREFESGERVLAILAELRGQSADGAAGKGGATPSMVDDPTEGTSGPSVGSP